MKRNLSIILVFCLAFFVSCSKSPTIKFDREEFDKQRAEWQKADIKDYSFTLSYFSSATGPLEETITVLNGKVTGDSDNGDIHWFKSSVSGIYESIETIFDSKKDNINDNPDYKVSDLILEIEYDNEYNFPKKATYTVGYEKPVDGGGGYVLNISSFNITSTSTDSK